jgi:hypothetical protein
MVDKLDSAPGIAYKLEAASEYLQNPLACAASLYFRRFGLKVRCPIRYENTNGIELIRMRNPGFYHTAIPHRRYRTMTTNAIRSASANQLQLRSWRFSLGALLEYVTLCAILCGLAQIVGWWSAVCLMVLALALAARRGELALAALGAGVVFDPLNGSAPIGRQFLTMGVAGGLGLWFGRNSQPAAVSNITQRLIHRFPPPLNAADVRPKSTLQDSDITGLKFSGSSKARPTS